MRIAAGGMRAASARADMAAADILSATTPKSTNDAAAAVSTTHAKVGSSPDLTRKFMDLAAAHVSFAANAVVFRTANAMYQELLDATDPRHGRDDDRHHRHYGVV